MADQIGCEELASAALKWVHVSSPAPGTVAKLPAALLAEASEVASVREVALAKHLLQRALAWSPWKALVTAYLQSGA